MKTDYAHKYTVTLQVEVSLDRWFEDGQERAEALVLKHMPSGDFARHTEDAYEVTGSEVVYVESLKCEHGSSLHDLCQWVEREVNETGSDLAGHFPGEDEEAH